jgi:hypothetical protein
LTAAVDRTLRELQQLTGEQRVAPEHFDDLVGRDIHVPTQRHQFEHDAR